MKPLSPNNLLNVLFFPISLVVCVALFLALASVSSASPRIWATCVPLLGILLAWIYLAAKATYDLYYDDEFVFLRRFGRQLTVPHSAIVSITHNEQGMKVQGVTAWQYVVTFDSKTRIGKQTIIEAEGGTRIKAFTRVVRKKNPTATIAIS